MGTFQQVIACSISTPVKERIGFVILRVVILIHMAGRHLKNFLITQKISMEFVFILNGRLEKRFFVLAMFYK